MLTKEKLLRCFSLLGDELDKLGLSGEILLTGGASMCLVHSARDMTKDVDALYAPKDEINRIAAVIADAEGIPQDWLNDSVKGFMTDNAQYEDFMEFKGLKVSTVSPQYLLAMKLISARYGEKDYEDVKFLMKKLHIKTEDEAKKVVTSFYPPERILPKTRYLIEQLVGEINKRKRDITR